MLKHPVLQHENQTCECKYLLKQSDCQTQNTYGIPYTGKCRGATDKMIE